MNEEHFRRYARLLVDHALSLRPGQHLFIRCSRVHRRLALAAGEAAYDRGARRVEYRFIDPLEIAQLIRRGSADEAALYHEDQRAWYRRVLQDRSPILFLSGDEFPDLWTELARTHAAEHVAFSRAASESSLDFYRHGVGRRWCAVVHAPGPTPGWATRVFPNLPREEAHERLAAELFRLTNADRPDALELLRRRDERLEARCRALDALSLREIRVAGGGNDLRLGLSPHARWRGSREITVDGQSFLPNFPSFEVFSTPDRRQTTGRLRVARPFRLGSGERVDELTLEFCSGEVIAFDAGRARRAFERWLAVDDGARFLGEIALVGEDSAVARTGLFFDHPILDENAAAHVALGQGYANCLANGDALTAQELEARGLNRSSTHTDVVFGSPRVDVVGKGANGETRLIEKGAWPLPRAAEPQSAAAKPRASAR